MERSVLTYFGACDGRFSDEQILAVLHDAECGTQPLSDLCAAHGITIPMYCVWKAKYRGLPPDALRARRRRADWRARALFGGVLLAGTMVVAAAAALIVFVGGSGVQADRDVAHAAAQVVPESDVDVVGAMRRELVQADTEVARAADGDAPFVPAEAVREEVRDATPAAAEPKPAPVVVGAPRADSALATGSASASRTFPTINTPAPAHPPSPNERYAVQVAAAPTPDHARAMVESLTAAGHPVHVVSVIVNNVEYFRVRVGPFDTQRAADEAAGTLKRSGYPGAWVVR